MENKQSNMYSYFWLTLYIFKLLSTIFIIIAITIFIITVIANISTLSLKAAQLKETSRSGGILTQTLKQPYSVCCLTGHVLKGVQCGDVNNMEMISRNNSNHLNLTYPCICVESWASV